MTTNHHRLRGRSGCSCGLHAILLLGLVGLLSACAGSYPALYTQPELESAAAVKRLEAPSAAGEPPAAGELPAAAAARSITVATLNMLHGLPRFVHLERRKHLILAELERLSPDVILLQEVPVFRARDRQIGPWLAESLGYTMAYARANGRAAWIGFEEGEAVLSRYPIREIRRHVLLPKPGLFENRIVLRAVLDTPLGALEVYNTHFSHRVNRDPLRLKQAEALVRFLRDSYRLRELPAVVGGDINAFPESAPMRFLREQGLVDIALAADPPADGATSWFEDITDPGDGPKARIDYLFLYSTGAENPLTVRRCTRFLNRPFAVEEGFLWASDHVGLLCELAPE